MVDRARMNEAFLSPVQDGPKPMLRVARMMRQEGQKARAFDLACQALALAPDDPEIQTMVRGFISDDVPDWHVPMLLDGSRNRAYDTALRHAIKPGTRVLDIGAGSGLLAMMAARAGAAQVFTVEVNPAIAAVARAIIARNGYADRVHVIAGHSDQIDVARDLGGPVDLLVSEIVSNNLLSEDVLATHARAVPRFLKPGGQVIPARGSIRIALAFDHDRDDQDLAMVEGFDLSPFNTLLPPSHHLPVGHERLVLRSDPTDLFSFDFADVEENDAARQASPHLVSHGGLINGVAQWIALDLDDTTRYENRPGPGATSSWHVNFHGFDRPIDTSVGQKVAVFGSHDRRHVMIWGERGTMGPGLGFWASGVEPNR